MAHHIFQRESGLQKIPEAAPKASPSFSVSEKLARYGSSALSGVEHLKVFGSSSRHLPAIIGQSAYAFVLVHNHLSGDPAPSEADIRLARRLAEGARILQINMLDHVIVGQPFDGRPRLFQAQRSGYDLMKTTKALFFELMCDFQSECWNEFELPKLSLRELLALAKLLGCPSCGSKETVIEEYRGKRRPRDFQP
jgi:RadC-like JAB domain